jgi:glutamate-ammonia-ligase adenylyltransferase
MAMSDLNSLIKTLPDPDPAERFFERLKLEKPADAQRLLKNEGLLSDVLTLVAYSPLLAATLMQNTQYFAWLNKRRTETKVRDKEELLEALARFTLTNSTLETNVLLSRFQRRELLRIYLRDIRGLGTISEITEELSHLADAVLEYALRVARQELDNRYGAPQVKDEKGRDITGKFTVVSLGKLGSLELNYASDIDLLFLYSEDGETSGIGSRGAVSNKEYFIKLSELVTKLVGQQAGEGAAYRVDLRLRPHGRIGALAISLKESVDYYHASARNWERQVLLRARSSAGDADLFKDFYARVEDVIYQRNVSLEQALETVRLSKLQIDMEHKQERGFNVKLGRGGIREIEFIAQAPQLALGDSDHWLRAPHTLISLSRLTDRSLLRKRELTQLSDAYSFLRSLEHRVQMENGLQTHAVPEERERRVLVARRMACADEESFNETLKLHTDNVSEVYRRLFNGIVSNESIKVETTDSQAFAEAEFFHKTDDGTGAISAAEVDIHDRNFSRINDSWEKFLPGAPLPEKHLKLIHQICEGSDAFSEMLAANPDLIRSLPGEENYAEIDVENFSRGAKRDRKLPVLSRYDRSAAQRVVENFPADRHRRPAEAAFDARDKLAANRARGGERACRADDRRKGNYAAFYAARAGTGDAGPGAGAHGR